MTEVSCLVVIVFMTYDEKECVICGKHFTPVNQFQKCCSKRCSKKHRRQYMKRYYEENKVELNQYRRDYYKKNRERINERRKEYDRRYRMDNEVKLREYQKNYREKRRSDSIDKMFGWYDDFLNEMK